jgi:hypothetical protein
MTDKMKRWRRIEAVGEDLKNDNKLAENITSIVTFKKEKLAKNTTAPVAKTLTKTSTESAKSVKVVGDVKNATKPAHAQENKKSAD